MRMEPKNTYLRSKKRVEEAAELPIPFNIFDLDFDKLYCISASKLREIEKVTETNIRYIIDILSQLQVVVGFYSPYYSDKGIRQRDNLINLLTKEVGIEAIREEGRYQGRYVRRLLQFLYESEGLGDDLKVDQEKLKTEKDKISSRLGEYLALNLFSVRGDFIYFDKVQALGWDVGEFGNPGSCYLPGREYGESIGILHDGNFSAFRFFTEEDDGNLRPFGRAWVGFNTPIDEKVLYFNTYGYGVENFSQLFQSGFGLNVKPINLYSRDAPVYVNNNKGWLCSYDQVKENSCDLGLFVERDYDDYDDDDEYAEYYYPANHYCHWGGHLIDERPRGIDHNGSILGICFSCYSSLSKEIQESFVDGHYYAPRGQSVGNYFNPILLNKDTALLVEGGYYSQSCLGHTVEKCPSCGVYCLNRNTEIFGDERYCRKCLEGMGLIYCEYTHRLHLPEEVSYLDSRPISNTLEGLRWVRDFKEEPHFIANCYLLFDLPNDSYFYVYKNEFETVEDLSQVFPTVNITILDRNLWRNFRPRRGYPREVDKLTTENFSTFLYGEELDKTKSFLVTYLNSLSDKMDKTPDGNRLSRFPNEFMVITN